MENTSQAVKDPAVFTPLPQSQPACSCNCSCSAKEDASAQQPVEENQESVEKSENEEKDEKGEKAEEHDNVLAQQPNPRTVQQYAPTDDEVVLGTGPRAGRFRRRAPRYSNSLYSQSRSPSRDRPPYRGQDTARSHEELIPVITDRTSTWSSVPTLQSHSVWLVPFNRSVYVTTHPATSVDFRRWLPLLALAGCEQWYSTTTLDIVIGQNSSVMVHGENPHAQQLQTVLIPKAEGLRAKGLSTPTIAATAALRTGLNDKDDKPSDDLIYFSVQESVAGYDNFRPNRRSYSEEREEQAPGTALYRVVQSGSREAAAARAFYDAGVHHFSTVFVCVAVVATFSGFRSLLSQPSSYERAKTLEELFELKGSGCTPSKTSLFY